MITKTTKLNESFYLLDVADDETKIKLCNRLSAPIKNAKYNTRVQAGIISPNEYFFKINPNNCNQVAVYSGLLNFLTDLGSLPYTPTNTFTDLEIQQHIDNCSQNLKFTPYDYQCEAVIGAIKNEKHFIRSATGSGKSVIIGLISDFLCSRGLKGLILVPNISLVNQFASDLKDYNLDVAKNLHLIGGVYNDKNFDLNLTISTYQSVMRFKEKLKELDFIIVDEGHGTKGNEIFDIVNKCINAKFKIGLSGTLPEEPVDRFRVIACFGKPKTYITTQGLIDRGLATPVKINILRLSYKNLDIKIPNNYSQQLKLIKEYEPRNQLIVNLATALKGNTLVLFQHTEHGIKLITDIYAKKGIKVYRNNIIGKSALVLQDQYKIYFINGNVDGDDRELIRKLIQNETNAIIVGNMACVSTGINIPNLHNLILASPLKSYVTITQSIGRGVRKHDSKSVFNLYDLADNLGLFRKQLNHRIETSYNPEGFKLNLRDLDL